MGCWGGDQWDGDTGVQLVEPPKGTCRVPCAAVPRMSLGLPQAALPGEALEWGGGERVCACLPPLHSPPGSPPLLGTPVGIQK